MSIKIMIFSTLGAIYLKELQYGEVVVARSYRRARDTLRYQTGVVIYSGEHKQMEVFIYFEERKPNFGGQMPN